MTGGRVPGGIAWRRVMRVSGVMFCVSVITPASARL